MTMTFAAPSVPCDETGSVDQRCEWRMEARARRAAKRVGLVAKKTRWRAGSIDNYGGFAIFDPDSNFIVCGEKFDLSAEHVIEFCRPDPEE